MFSWNLAADLADMWSYPFMLNAFRAGTAVAVLAAVCGWFMVLRRQTFAGHTLAIVGFPGAAVAVWLGLGATVGYFGFALAAAVVIALVPAASRGGYSQESAAVGTVQSFALATGLLFIALYHGFLGNASALLFGSFLGITRGQVGALALVAVAVLAVLAAIGRPLLFASIDTAVARAHGVPVRVLDVAFLLLLGASTAAVSQITGVLLVFALLVLPPATAQVLTARPGPGIALAVLVSVATVWIALFVAFYSPYPVGFWVSSVAFAGYLLAQAWAWARRRPPVRTPEAVA
jgi:zinc/manganese transport system permease protein